MKQNTLLPMDLNSSTKIYNLEVNVEFFINRSWEGAWAVAWTFQYRQRTDSIKPSLQHFQCCRCSRFFGFPFFLYFFDGRNWQYNVYFILYIFSFEHPLVMEPGYSLEVKCHYDSSLRGETTRYGDSTSEEMCFTVIMYYPANNWEQGKGKKHFCCLNLFSGPSFCFV
jgi:hypothetical protein